MQHIPVFHVCAHLWSNCLAEVFRAHGWALWQTHREQIKTEREREGEGVFPVTLNLSQPHNLRLSNVGYSARVSSIFHTHSAITCLRTHTRWVDLYTVIIFICRCHANLEHLFEAEGFQGVDTLVRSERLLCTARDYHCVVNYSVYIVSTLSQLPRGNLLLQELKWALRVFWFYNLLIPLSCRQLAASQQGSGFN